LTKIASLAFGLVKESEFVHAGTRYAGSIFLVRVWNKLSAAILIVELVVPRRVKLALEIETMLVSIEL
jgi:hypothetical protein